MSEHTFPPNGWRLVPNEPTPEIIAGAAIAAWPTASAADIAMARKAAPIVLMSMGMNIGSTADSAAAALATMAPAYRAMLAAAPTPPAPQPVCEIVQVVDSGKVAQPMTDEQIVRAAICAIASDDQELADDVLGGYEFECSAKDLVLIWKAALLAAQEVK